MKNVITITVLMLAAFLSNAQTLLSGPQKIVIDKEHIRYLVSNYNNGAIVAIDNEGTQEYFVQAAGFIDGLEIVGDTVYGVGSNGKVRAYNLTTKQLVMNITITGSNTNYLSSITSDSAGHLFVSCPALHTIYKLRISDQSYWVFAENNGLNRPNGILLEKEKNRIVVINDSPNTSDINAISFTDSTVSLLMSNNFHYPDGIERDKNGYYYVGGYYLPGLYQINPDFSGEPEMFFAGSHMIYPTYNEVHHSLLITYYGQNDWEEIFLTTSSIESNELQRAFVLSKNYPNPFAERTSIQFEIKDYAHARLEVLDTSGIIINTLVNEKKQTGTYSVSWDGKNNSGKQVSNGTYYFKLTVNGSTEIQRVIILK